MKLGKIFYGMSLVTLVFFQGACGGSSGTSATSTTTTTTKVTSTGAVPEFDISELSASEGSASASISKGLAGDVREQADFKALFSRLGCEVNMNLEEIGRQGDQLNSMLCHMRKAEKAGFKIGTDTFVYNVIEIPAPPADMKEKLDEDRKNEREFHNAGEEEFDDKAKEDFRPDGQTMIVRAGTFNGNELRIDGAVQISGSESKRLFEATITTDEAAKKVTAMLINSFPHGGKNEGSRIDITGTNVTISDGVMTQASDAVVDIIGQISGLFGDIRFEYSHDKANAADKIRFYHKGIFNDFQSGVANNFTTSVRAVQNETCGCGEGNFSGQVPAMPASDLIENCPTEHRGEVLQNIGQSEGLSLTQSSKLCPGQQGLSLASGDTCSISHTFGECYSIGIEDVTIDLGKKLKNRKYSVVPSSQCANPKTASDAWTSLSSPTIDTTFTREWDGTLPAGDTGNAVDMSALAESDMKECMAYEERYRNRRGAGGEACFHQEHRKVVENDMKDDGFQLDEKGSDPNFVGHQEEVRSEQQGSYTLERCWSDTSCTSLTSPTMVSQEACKTSGGQGWGPNSGRCSTF
ncbi:MAG: hypothetical protein A3C46_03155 [Deltaproteobacteria bacterium RIFCSPHIGHO2_02_FULL_44_16]|nr:MAG: hypothetical protein A3C46_03155 [Deltaproteobacteria bacterium RIFCSPHIGHO2_02_FULL_44_16]